MTPSPPSASLPSARRRASNTGIVLIVLAVGLLLPACGRGRAQPVSCVTAIDNATVLIPDTVSVEGDASPFFSPDSLAALSPDDTCVGAEAPRVQALRLAAPSPNPVRDAVRIRFATPERQTVKLKLYDMLGRVVWTFGGGRVKGRHEVQADLSGLASGAYFLRLRSEGDTRTRRITVVR